MLTKINHLQCLNSLKPKDRLAVVDICSDDCIQAVCGTEDVVISCLEEFHAASNTTYPMRGILL